MLTRKKSIKSRTRRARRKQDKFLTPDLVLSGGQRFRFVAGPDDPLRAAERVRAEFAQLVAAHHAKVGQFLEHAYGVAAQFRRRPRDFERFQVHEFWKQTGQKPRDRWTSKWVLLLMMEATTTKLQTLAGKFAVILDGLLQDQVEVSAVAARIKELGGVVGAYEAMQTRGNPTPQYENDQDMMQMKPTAKSKGVLKTQSARAEPSKIKPAARKDFVHPTHDVTRGEPKPLVATMTGYRGLKFVLPRGLDPQGPANVERNFDQRYRRYHDRLHRAGTIQGWLALAKLCRSKSRLVAALCLAFTGPVCGAFGYKAPGLQFHGSGGTTIGRVAATVWGGEVAYGDPALDTTMGWHDRRLGCGVSGVRMKDSLKVVAAAFNQMLLFLNHSDGEEDTILEIMTGGDGPDRRMKTQCPRFRVPLLSGSSRSFVAITKGSNQNDALVDSVADIPVPFRWPYLFEGISVTRELQAFERRLNVLGDNFGWAGPEFVRQVTKELERGSGSLIRAIADELRKKYQDAVADIKSRAGRDLTRITDQFATIYVAGCLAIRFKILPFTETEVRLWLLICQHDHVAFVDRELGAW